MRWVSGLGCSVDGAVYVDSEAWMGSSAIGWLLRERVWRDRAVRLGGYASVSGGVVAGGCAGALTCTCLPVCFTVCFPDIPHDSQNSSSAYPAHPP